MCALHAAGPEPGGVITWRQIAPESALVAGFCIAFVVTNLSNGLTVPEQDSGAVPVPQRVRVAQDVSTSLLVKKVAPEYSKDLKKQRIQGMVTLRLPISKEGDVIDVRQSASAVS